MSSDALYPLTFIPIFKERVWGGRRLEDLYGKRLPSGVPIGESWELSDRPGDVSVVANGPLAGKDLHWLLEHRAQELMGAAALHQGRFPLLIKILDAQEKLSLQVHPPSGRAGALGGEPKTEMWYVALASPDAELYVGLRRDCTRQEFIDKLQSGTVADCFHRIRVRAGDAMFLPSGRVHALGAGTVIFEIQQNSDTTYRVFDWNRRGLDGKPRDLHLEQSLKSIQFDDFEPGLVQPQPVPGRPPVVCLVNDPLFRVESARLSAGASLPLLAARMQIIAMVSGKARVQAGPQEVALSSGQFCLVPASIAGSVFKADALTTCLLVQAGQPAVL